MKPRTLIPLVIGLAVGFFAIKMGIDMVRRAKGDESGQQSVLVSSRQIDVASRIRESMLDTTSVPANMTPADVFTDIKALAGRVTAMTIPPGVPITKAMLAPPGAEPGLRATIPSGLRAVSVRVNEESAVAGFIAPGCRVDVSTVSSRGSQSKLILSDVQVGAVGQSLSQVGADGKTVRVTKSVTLFLRPEDVQILNAHSGRGGSIRLALRGNTEKESTGSFWASLLAKARQHRPRVKKAVKTAPKVQHHVVEVVRGSEEIERLVFVKNDRNGRYERVDEEYLSGQRPGSGQHGNDDDSSDTEIDE